MLSQEFRGSSSRSESNTDLFNRIRDIDSVGTIADAEYTDKSGIFNFTLNQIIGYENLEEFARLAVRATSLDQLYTIYFSYQGVESAMREFYSTVPSRVFYQKGDLDYNQANQGIFNNIFLPYVVSNPQNFKYGIDQVWTYVFKLSLDSIKSKLKNGNLDLIASDNLVYYITVLWGTGQSGRAILDYYIIKDFEAFNPANYSGNR
jgi:hypothetical protein